MTPRRLAVLLKHLPPDSAFIRAAVPGYRAEVDVLSDLYDLTALRLWQAGGDDKAEKPPPYPRHGDAARAEAKVRDRKNRLQALQALAESEGGV